VSPAFSGPIAIDGPAASGKTTVGLALADQLGFGFLDTGVMYRAFTLAALREGISPEDADACAALAERLPMRLEMTPAGTALFLGDEDVTPLLRDTAVETAVSGFSAIPAVRQAMVALQRELADEGGVILAGRDIGTVVLPNAPVKLFLTASEEQRAMRRGEQSAHGAELSREHIAQRDRVDSSRTASPLRPADDAIVIDTSDMTLDEVIARASEIVANAATTGAVTPGQPQAKAKASGPDREQVRREPPKLRGTHRIFTPAFYFGGNYLMSFLLTVITRWKVHGRENIPAEGPLIFVSNHLNNTDPPILACVVRNRHHVRFMAKVELFRGRFGWLAPLWGAFPLRRFEADLGAVLTAERILRAGGSLGMFPEGTRSRTQTMAALHPGSASLALRTGATLVPCSIAGSEKIRSPKVLIQRVSLTVRVGEPIPVERVKRPTEAQVSALTARLDAAIRSLLPPSYGGTYTGS
jgi:cytidylate kinase